MSNFQQSPLSGTVSPSCLEPQVPTDRILFHIPKFDKFGEILHDRLHGLLYYTENIEGKFTLITNYFDRDEDRINFKIVEGETDLEGLVYGGTHTQRELLEKNEPNKLFFSDIDTWKKNRALNWAELQNKMMLRDMRDVETFTYFDEFRQGLVSLESIKPGTLKEYFSELKNKFRENELPILRDYFDIERDKYIGIPLLGLGLFQGIVWIVFEETQTEKFTDPNTIIRLIKQFMIAYDTLLLDWDTAEDNMKRISVLDKVIEEITETNPIQEICGVKKYYTIQRKYYTEKIKRSDEVVNEIFKTLNRTAIITILLDSFAHNISAHSLTALSWWFRERADYLDTSNANERLKIEQMGQNQNPLILFSQKYPNKTLSKELYPLFKFLLEKGAFWSGITRRTNFTGKTSSLYSILWYDFINNPLYLGTIANTEKVKKLHLNITIYQEEIREDDAVFINRKVIKKNQHGVLLDGAFATINFADFWDSPHPDSRDSVFVQKGTLYEALKLQLEQLRVFFPSGVVGKHAFFTLLENEIRNVKHYQGEILQGIQENGLVLNLSFHLRPIDSSAETTDQQQLVKVGVWLKHPIRLDARLLLRYIQGLDSGIITKETSQPQLGGNYQDKICASMLLTNSFYQVQEESSDLGLIYYPWIKTAGYRIREESSSTITEFEVSHRKYKNTTAEKFEQAFVSEKGKGYLKKYFHLWVGADILELSQGQESVPELENPARFRFLVLPNASKDLCYAYQSQGIFRILTSAKPNNVGEAYQQWLGSWLKDQGGNHNMAIDFKYGDTLRGRLMYHAGKCIFQSYQELKRDPLLAIYQSLPQKQTLVMIHGNSKVANENTGFNYRTHGELQRHFLGGKAMEDVQTLSLEYQAELMEVLATRICIFDRRGYNRLFPQDSTGTIPGIKDPQKGRLDFYRNNVFLDFRGEDLVEFEQVRSQGFQNLHFLVLHLSFIETMPDGKEPGSTYDEERIIEFIDQEILQGIPPEAVANNFFLVITTGRGRMIWWEKIQARPEYSRFVTFRPIESILSVVEDALQMHDDFEMKYNMVKLLFGS